MYYRAFFVLEERVFGLQFHPKAKKWFVVEILEVSGDQVLPFPAWGLFENIRMADPKALARSITSMYPDVVWFEAEDPYLAFQNAQLDA